MKKQLFTMLMFAFVVFSANALIYSVTVPTGTKACYISGEMNGWTHQQMTKVDDTHYTVNIAIADTTQKYKYCSGPGWGYVEKGTDKNDIENRSYSANDVVVGWAAIYDKNVRDVNMVYKVTVPKGTNCCYILGGWDGWKSFLEMKKVDATHYTITVKSNKMLKYNYFAGKGWGYVEFGANKGSQENRNYSTNDVVLKWAAVYNKSVPDANLTYNVTVPVGTNSCYIAGGWNGWSFLEMKKVDTNHFRVTVMSNKALKYMYLSGPDWSYVESGSDKIESAGRSYSPNDVVASWSSVWTSQK